MPVCSNCKAEYIKGKKICSYCGQELYRGLLTDLSDDENIFNQIDWVKLTNVDSDNDADTILKQLIGSNIPAMKRSNGVSFEDIGVFHPGSIDIYVPQWLEKKASDMIN